MSDEKGFRVSVVEKDVNERKLTFNSYQEATKETAIYFEGCASAGVPNWVYSSYGLGSEAGEVLGKFKKIIRDHKGITSPEAKEALGDELGDILWYVARVADDLGISLKDIASNNINKLLSRKYRGVLEGSGDDR